MYIPQPQTQLVGPELGDHLLSSVYLTPGEQTKQDVNGFLWNSLFGFEALRRSDGEATLKKKTTGDLMTIVKEVLSFNIGF